MKLETYKYIKTDHDSDCGVYNAPAMANTFCTCGFFPNPVEAANEYLRENGPFIHEGERQSIGDAFMAGFNSKSTIPEDINYLLEEYNSFSKELFDTNGESFIGYLKPSAENLELMHHLICKLSEYIQATDNKDYCFNLDITN